MGITKKAAYGLFEAAILFSIFYLPSYVTQNRAYDLQVFNDIRFYYQICLILISQILIVLIVIHRDKNHALKDFGLVSIKRGDIPYFFKCLLIFSALVLGLQGIFLLFSLSEPLQENTVQLQNRWFILLFLAASSLIGYSEEIFFRSYLFERFSILKGHPLFHILIINIIFAAGHLYEGPSGALSAFILGLYFSWIYRRKKSIHIPAIMHSLYNFTALLISFML